MTEPTSPSRRGSIDGRKVLTTKEAAIIFRVSPGTIRDWASQGWLQGWRTPGGHWRFFEDDIFKVVNELPTEGPWA